MNEKDLNIEYICEKTLLNKDDELVPIILSLIQESYKAGLCQTEFDNTMNLIEENQELKEKFKATNKGLQKAVLKRKKWKYRYQLARCEIKELKEKLDKYENPEDMTLFVMWCTEKVKDENLELKKQLENCYCNRTDCSGRIKDSKVYDSLVQKVETQQKEFIKFLEDEISKQKNDIFANALTSEDIDLYIMKIKLQELEEILRKYKEIVNGSEQN